MRDDWAAASPRVRTLVVVGVALLALSFVTPRGAALPLVGLGLVVTVAAGVLWTRDRRGS